MEAGSSLLCKGVGASLEEERRTLEGTGMHPEGEASARACLDNPLMDNCSFGSGLRGKVAFKSVTEMLSTGRFVYFRSLDELQRVASTLT